jgi:hypothetical protein
MDETFRMLGREHQADLQREVERWRLADEARRPRNRWFRLKIDRTPKPRNVIREVIGRRAEPGARQPAPPEPEGQR